MLVRLRRKLHWQFIRRVPGAIKRLGFWGKRHVSRAESLRYMGGSDVNGLLQTISEGQDVVSGKAFDYLHAQKPILAAVDEAGGDAWFVRETHSGRIAPWHDTNAVACQMMECFRAWQSGVRQLDESDTGRYSRRNLTARLAQIFDEVLEAQTASKRDEDTPARA